jgi:hypothetical protein
MKFAVHTIVLVISQSAASAGQLDVLDSASLFSGVFSSLPVNIATDVPYLDVASTVGISINAMAGTSSQNVNINQGGETQDALKVSPLTDQLDDLTQNSSDFERVFSIASPQKKEAIISLLTKLKNNKFSSNAEKIVYDKLLVLLGG